MMPDMEGEISVSQYAFRGVRSAEALLCDPNNLAPRRSAWPGNGNQGAASCVAGMRVAGASDGASLVEPVEALQFSGIPVVTSLTRSLFRNVANVAGFSRGTEPSFRGSVQ